MQPDLLGCADILAQVQYTSEVKLTREGLVHVPRYISEGGVGWINYVIIIKSTKVQDLLYLSCSVQAFYTKHF